MNGTAINFVENWSEPKVWDKNNLYLMMLLRNKVITFHPEEDRSEDHKQTNMGIPTAMALTWLKMPENHSSVETTARSFHCGKLNVKFPITYRCGTCYQYVSV